MFIHVSVPAIIIVVCQDYKHLVTLLSPCLLQNWRPAPLALFFTFLHKCTLPVFSHVGTDPIQQHLDRAQSPSYWYAPTNVTFNGHFLSRKTHAYIHSPTQRPCCVLSDRTQMAATWCVLMGSCNDSGQDMDTHTDGNPLSVDGGWTCWLLICSDQWFTTWSSDTGGMTPTELAHWPVTFGTHSSEHKF